ncbi:epidermal growth factor-like protein 6 isoform X3 [Cygnus olor]|uniref:epidermal growth factor-like protein 6 isoform X3 n=1 Tax=Cygnus olor TaxID=8869 RepID=UPI001ADE5DA8|nr:epidermal growth factor-like protein 6 isoform X3 [Cygnus olor]
MVPAPGGALLLLLLLLLAALLLAAAGSSRVRGQLVTVSQPGVCRYGSRMDCCYGWKKNSKGHCEAICGHGCKYGECLGPNKCKCFPGFTGKTCNQDLNECGLKPRPCEHRCMNTHGSYKCYCLNGYMLMPDGTCASSRTCAMVNCQYGCEKVKEDVQCLCPSAGLQLGPNGRTCVDIDECSTGRAVCSFNRRCVNTFGSYYCKCQLGYELKYIGGHYDCVDVNECVANTHRCNLHAECLNTEGSFKCKCKQGYQGSGFDCTVPQGKEAAAFGPLLAQRNVPVSRPEQEVDCSFSRGVCDWKQDTNDDFDWNPADRDRGDGYYMAVPAFVGHKKDTGRLKLLLNDLKPKSSYCLIFSYRLAGERVGKLRVFLANKKTAPVWEENKGKDERWRTGKVEIFQGAETTNTITFESERGKGKTGEIGVDNVILVSGLCREET